MRSREAAAVDGAGETKTFFHVIFPEMRPINMIVLVMVAASVTLLPAFLGLAGQRINRRGRRHVQVDEDAAVSERWMRWGGHVSRHAWGYVVGGTALLLVLTAPVLALRLGFPDEGSLPQSRTERLAYDLVAEGFGPGINGPLVIAVDISEDAAVVDPRRLQG